MPPIPATCPRTSGRPTCESDERMAWPTPCYEHASSRMKERATLRSPGGLAPAGGPEQVLNLDFKQPGVKCQAAEVLKATETEKK